MNDNRTQQDSDRAGSNDTGQIAPGGPAPRAELVDRIVAAVVGSLERQRRPQATYRVQLNSECTFRDVERILPYLHKLGISDLYASPFLKARAGSVHGYDVVDHSAINDEIGTREDLEALHAALSARGMGLIADVVPNHMGVASDANAWWIDVLENGPSSTYAAYFDIDWMPLKPDLAHKVLLPVLGDQYGKVLEDGQLVLHYDEGAFRIEYFSHRFPVAPVSYRIILQQRLEELTAQIGESHADLQELLSILTAIRNLPPRTEQDVERLAERRREKEVIKRRLHQLVQSSTAIAEFVAENVRRINGRPGDPRSFDHLDELLKDQAYRLAYWRTAADEINYRRFFDINELAAICTENPSVFHDTHRLVFELLEAGIVSGLRIDHPDGLYDPRGYLRQLQEQRFLQLCRGEFRRLCASPTSDAASSEDEAWPPVEQQLREMWRAAVQIPGSPLATPLYVVVEKILAHDEFLPQDWPVDGTVGYEHLNLLTGLFVDARNERAVSTAYSRMTGETLDFEELAYLCKRLIVRMSMASELNVLGHRLDRISEQNRWTRDFTLPSLTRALQEIVACFGVYRTYVEPGLVLERDREYIDSAVARAKRRNPAMSASVFDFVRDTLLVNIDAHAGDEERRAVASFAGKFQQLTGPIMARAIEDTAFYRFNRLVALNEVGGEPAQFGHSVADFHKLNESRLQRHPFAMNGTSTHDTKRSEDVRTRICVLSEIPREWDRHVRRWHRSHQRFKTPVDRDLAPSANDEYLLYQTIVGTWPGALPDGPERAAYIERMQQHLLKVAREAKVHTSWISPHAPYEEALSRFVERIFEKKGRGRSFPAEMEEFAQKAADHGMWNSLSQVVLKIGSPGVPDFYQGSGFWNLSLVDPDNRRPVDFRENLETLERLFERMADALGLADRDTVIGSWSSPPLGEHEPCSPAVQQLLSELIERRVDSRIKLFTTVLSLHARRLHSDPTITGRYVPLETSGRHSDRVAAFALADRGRTLLIVAPRLTVGIVGFGGPPPLGQVWDDTQIAIPADLALCEGRNVLTRERLSLPEGTGSLRVAEILRHFPVAVVLSSGPAS